MRRLTVVVVSVLACVFGGSTVVLGQQLKTLHGAAATGDAPQLKKHIDNKEDLNIADDNGNTPIKLAVEANSLECINMLLQAGANVNAKDSAGNTPLMVACMAGEKEVEEVLLAAKADHAAKNATGMTALHVAAMMRQLDVVEPLIKAGADVNAKDNDGQTPVVLAQRSGAAEVVELLRQNGATMPVVQDPMAMYGAPSQGGATPTVAGSRRPDNFVIDPNVIARQILEAGTLDAPLKVIDANSQNEQRAWIARRSDNRTTLVRYVQKQFEDEMAFVKKVAAQENAVKTTKAVDDLVTARKKRYERIGTELRDQRRQTMQESRDTGMTNTTGRGGRGSSGRSMRGRGANAGGAAGQDVYGTATQTRAARRTTTAEPGQAPLDVDTQAQIQAWTSASAEDKAALLQATSELDVVEYAVLAKSAEEEKAVKSQVAVMALLMLREERAANIRLKWVEDDARTQRMQERGGANGTQGTQPGTGQGTQRGMRRGGR